MKPALLKKSQAVVPAWRPGVGGPALAVLAFGLRPDIRSRNDFPELHLGQLKGFTPVAMPLKNLQSNFL